MQRKQQQFESKGRVEGSPAEMCRARLPGQDRRVLWKRLKNAPVRSRVRNPLRRSRADY